MKNTNDTTSLEWKADKMCRGNRVYRLFVAALGVFLAASIGAAASAADLPAPWVDVRTFMDGQNGRPTFDAWKTNQATTDVLAVLVAARRSLPNFPGDPLTESGEKVKVGTLFFPPGTYRVSDTFKFSAGTLLQGAGQFQTKIKFMDNVAISVEKFVLQSDRTLLTGSPMAMISHGTGVIGIEIDGNRPTNRYSSGLLFYGAEMNILDLPYVGNSGKRGLVIGGTNLSGHTKGSAIYAPRIWVNGVSEGPGIQINSYGGFIGNLSVADINAAGQKSGGDYIPAVKIVASDALHIASLVGENASGVFCEINESYGLSIEVINGAMLTEDAGKDRTCIKINSSFGYGYMINIGQILGKNYASALNDAGWYGGTQRNKVIAGSATTNFVLGPYSTYNRVYESHSDSAYFNYAKVTGGPKTSNHSFFDIDSPDAATSELRFTKEGKLNKAISVDASSKDLSFYDATTALHAKWKMVSGGDFQVAWPAKGIVLTNAAGTITKRVRLNDTGTGLIFEDP